MLLAPDSSAVVVVAGLPGAGKTTLVAGEARALDSDTLREAWAPRLGGLPYALWRPLVHARHWVAIWRSLARPDGVIVVRPFTSGWLRRADFGREPWTSVVRVAREPAQSCSEPAIEVRRAARLRIRVSLVTPWNPTGFRRIVWPAAVIWRSVSWVVRSQGAV